MEQQRQKQQQIVESWQAGGKARHIAVITVAAVNSDTWCSVALAVGLTAERLVGARLHYPTWQTDRDTSRMHHFAAAVLQDPTNLALIQYTAYLTPEFNLGKLMHLQCVIYSHNDSFCYCPTF